MYERLKKYALLFETPFLPPELEGDVINTPRFAADDRFVLGLKSDSLSLKSEQPELFVDLDAPVTEDIEHADAKAVASSIVFAAQQDELRPGALLEYCSSGCVRRWLMRLCELEAYASSPSRLWYCGVTVKGNPTVYSYISDTGELEAGSFVLVPFGAKDTPRVGKVKSCGEFSVQNAPYPVDKTKRILRSATADEYAASKSSDSFYSSEYGRRFETEAELADYLIQEEKWSDLLEWADENESADDLETGLKVVECYMRCVKHGSAGAAMRLGRLYFNGQFVPKDERTAIAYYKYAADRGILSAMRRCGDCLYLGSPESLDFAEAFKYYSSGALIHNDPSCMYMLGDMYLNGHFVERNTEYAYKLYFRAVELCRDQKDEISAGAKLRLGRCLLHGVGTKQAVGLAYRFLSGALDELCGSGERDAEADRTFNELKDLISLAIDALDGQRRSPAERTEEYDD